MSYILQISTVGVADLDGATPLDIDGVGVTVDRTESDRIIVTVPDGTPLGTIDPGQVLQGKGEHGNTYVVLQASVVGAAAFAGGTTNNIRRILGGESEVLTDLTATAGAVLNGKVFFQPDVLLGVNTDVGGPFEINILIKRIDDEDFAEPALGPISTTPATSPQTYQDRFVFDGAGGATFLPAIFATWPEAHGAITALVATNVAGTQMSYTLAMTAQPSAGTFDINGAELDSFGEIFDVAVNSPIIFTNAVTLNNPRSYSNVQFQADGAAPPFAHDSTRAFTPFKNSRIGGGTTPVIDLINIPMKVRLDNSQLQINAITSQNTGDAINIEVGENSVVAANAVDSTLPGSVDTELRIIGDNTHVSLTQGGTVGLFLGSTGALTSLRAAGSTVIFSAAVADLSAILVDGDPHEIYAGGNFAAPFGTWVAAPSPVDQLPQTTPFKGIVFPGGYGYIRGIGLTVPLPAGTVGDVVNIQLYINGVLTVTESFDPTVSHAFAATQFGTIEAGDVLECFVDVVSLVGQTSWADGFLVSVHIR